MSTAVSVTRSTPTYTMAEVARHDSPADCWVVVNGGVVDVTSFLHSHPGGVAALSKEGRAGCGVTSHFERIGHSDNAKAILKSMQIGVLMESASDDIDESASLLGNKKSRAVSSKIQAEREHAVRWHAARRQAILKAHPEVGELIGSNPWTCVIGLLTVLVHGYTCLWLQRQESSWYITPLAAYTVGAVCKMYQFAVNHDICHGTAGTWLKQHSFFKHLAMQIMTLPTMGGAMHTYYEFQHMGHHASLGVHALGNVLGLPEKDLETTSIFESKGAKEKFALDGETINNMIFFPDSDGDLFAIGNLSFGKILERWGRTPADPEVGKAEENIRFYINPDVNHSPGGFDILKEFHKSRFFKCLAIQVLHVSHQATMAIVLYLQTLLLLPLITIPMFAFPRWISKTIIYWTRRFNDEKPILDGVSDDEEFLLVCTMVRISSSVGLHAWVSLFLSWWLLFGHLGDTWTVVSALKGFFYLYLSELFLYGFAMHPFMGYFLGVHRSGGGGFESKKATQSDRDQASHGCQPTMSTYCFFASLASLNLTYHVEHHDFPGIPWSRLPTVSRLAPEFYDHLEQSSGFCATIYRWVQYSGEWSYACH